MGKKAVVILMKALPSIFLTEENHENTQSGQWVTLSLFELRTSAIKVRSVIA
jgi:hypothetical protein